MKCVICGNEGSEGFGYVLCDTHYDMVEENVREYVALLKPRWRVKRKADWGRYIIEGTRSPDKWSEYYAIEYAAAEALYHYMKQEKGE